MSQKYPCQGCNQFGSACLCSQKDKANRVMSCLAACAGIKDLEKQIKALVEAAKEVLLHATFGAKELESALEPFKEPSSGRAAYFGE